MWLRCIEKVFLKRWLARKSVVSLWVIIKDKFGIRKKTWDKIGMIVEVIGYWCSKWCESCSLKNVVKTCIQSTYYAKNVFGTIFLMTSFQKWENIIVCLVCVCVCVFFLKVMTCSLINKTYSFWNIYKSVIEQHCLKIENW